MFRYQDTVFSFEYGTRLKRKQALARDTHTRTSRPLDLSTSLPSEATKRHAIESLLSPTWPIQLEEGSFYDWVGSVSAEDRPHLLQMVWVLSLRQPVRPTPFVISK